MIDKIKRDSEMLERMYEDMYLGRGVNDPPIVTRLDRIEQMLDSLRTWKWVMIGAILAMIGNIVAGHLR